MSCGEEWRPDLCSGGSHCTARNLDIEAALRIFFSAEGGVVVGLPASLPVAHRFPDGLEDAAVRRQFKNCNESSRTATATASLVSYEGDKV